MTSRRSVLQRQQSKSKDMKKRQSFFYIFWLERRRRCEALGANVLLTTDVGLPQAQVCYICQKYGRRKNHKTEMNSVLKISYFVAGIFTRNNTGL